MSTTATEYRTRNAADLSRVLARAGIDHWTEGTAVIVPQGTNTAVVHTSTRVDRPWRVTTFNGPPTLTPTAQDDHDTATLVEKLRASAACRRDVPAPLIPVMRDALDATDRERLDAAHALEAVSRARYLAGRPDGPQIAVDGPRWRLTRRGEYVAALLSGASIVGAVTAVAYASGAVR